MNLPRKEGKLWYCDLVDYSLNRIVLDYALTLIFLSDRLEVMLRLERDFSLQIANNQFRLNPHEYIGINHLRGLLSKKVGQIIVDESGNLDITFLEPNLKISVTYEENYEAWTLSNTNGLLFVSLPNGGLATWVNE